MKEFFIDLLLFFGFKSHAQIQFDIQSEFGQAIDEYYYYMLPPYILEPIAYAQIEELFAEIQNSGLIEFRYPQNECQYRAHAIARILLEKGVKSNKIWSFNPALLGRKESHELTVPDPNFEGDKIAWAFHVAPVVLAKFPDNQTELVVLDASLFDKPVSYKFWLNSLKCRKQYYTFVHSKYVQYAVDENNILTGVWNTDAYSVDNGWISTSINKGKIFYSYLEREVFPLKEKLKQIEIQLSTSGSAIEIAKLEFEKEEILKLYLQRKNIAVNSELFEQLPIEYQSRLYEYEQRSIDQLCWENIEIGNLEGLDNFEVQ